jgi:hypothetical protein
MRQGRVLPVPSVQTALLALVLAVVSTLLVLRLLDQTTPKRSMSSTSAMSAAPSGAQTCSAATCGATDPVSDPAYNMRQIAMQCILLEEHLTVQAKYCVDCIAKHILHCHGLANEALMLASSSKDPQREYPYMRESAVYFDALMTRWLEQRNDEAAIAEIASELRVYRKKLVEVYIVGGQH